MPTNIADVLKAVSGTGFLGIDTRTVVALRGGKSNPHVGNVYKIVTGSSVMCFQNKFINGYDAQVKRRLEKEGKDPGNFQLGPRKWGERLWGLPLVRHMKDGKEVFYLEAIFITPGEITFEYDGKPIDKADIVGMPDKPEEAEQGGLDNKVILRTYALDSVKTIRIDHQTFNGPFYVQL